MPVTEQQADALRKARLPIHGWVDEGDGHFTAPEQSNNYTTREYSRFARLTRSRWDLVT